MLEEKGVKTAEADTARGELKIRYNGERPKLARLNKLFAKENYVFGKKEEMGREKQKGNMLKAGGIGLILMAGFLVLNKCQRGFT